MRRFIYVLFLFLPLQIFADQFVSVEHLISRQVPWLKGKVVFHQLKSYGADEFELFTHKGKVNINASGPNAAATALNWYLKYYCHRSISHMGNNLAPVIPLPDVPEKVHITAPSKYRYALNYCTLNYTMSFYNWQDWERELDWMALNGVNMMLTVTGMEAVWQNTLQRIGYSEQEINDFIVGPAYTAWWLMGNIEGWGGPMPQSQIDSRKELQQKIIKRMRELGIQPVIQGFYGMVPSSLKNKINAHIIEQGNWGAFVRPDILDPTDTSFARIAGIYYEEIQKLYGKDFLFFAGDPFHEGGKTDDIDLAEAGKSIQLEMNNNFPGSTWVLQGWQDNPKKDMLDGLDKSKVLVQELFGEYTNNWEKRDGYESTPFIWCCVNNFGERPGLFGKLQRYVDEIHRIRQGPYKDLNVGVGIMPEGLNNNPLVYDLMLELGWRNEPVDIRNWIDEYAQYRYGIKDNNISQAWQVFQETVYQSLPGYQEGASESVFCMRPSLDGKIVSVCGTRERDYDTTKFEAAVKLFAELAPKLENNETYCIDLINFVRQVLANRGEIIYQQLVDAFNNKDMVAFEKSTDKFLQMIDLEDDLLNSDDYFRLSKWQEQALRLGSSQTEEKLNMNNAMMLITYWGENNRSEDILHEYSYREWSGMMKSFYKKRWELYFDYLKKELKGKKAEAPDYFAWERQWVKDHQQVISEPVSNDLLQVVNQVLEME